MFPSIPFFFKELVTALPVVGDVGNEDGRDEGIPIKWALSLSFFCIFSLSSPMPPLPSSGPIDTVDLPGLTGDPIFDASDSSRERGVPNEELRLSG